jgi:outer membrane protein TolC
MSIKVIPKRNISRKIGRLLLYTILSLPILLSFSSHTLAEEGGSSQPELKVQDNKVELSLKSISILALKNNLDIAFEGYNPQLKEADIVQVMASFDTTFSTQFTKDRTVSQSGTFLASGTQPTLAQQNYTYKLSLSKKFTLGTDIDFSYKMNELKSSAIFASFNPWYSTSWQLDLTQPLWKDFGIQIGRTQIKIASLNKNISENTFKSKVMEVLHSVHSDYWNLFYCIRDFEAKKHSLDLAKDFLKNSKIKIEAGTLAPVEIYQAEAEVATREEDVIAAKSAIKEAEDSLKKDLNILDKEEYWDLTIIPSDQPVTDVQPPPLPEAIKIAIEKRPDYLKAVTDIEAKNIKVKYTKNQLYPRLDIIGTIGTSGIAGQPKPPADFMGGDGTTTGKRPYTGSARDAFDYLDDGDYYTYSIGLKFEFPLENHYAKSELSRAKVEVAKALTTLKNTETTIINEVKGAIRDVETNLELIRAGEASLKYAQEKLKAEQKKYEVGLSTIHDLLQYQKDLSTAESTLAKALYEYNKSLSNLAKVKGTLLDEYGLTL